MTDYRVICLAVALFWGACANAQGTDAEPTDEELPTEIPEELLQSQTMEEIEVIVGPQGETAFELEMQRQAALQEAVFAEARMRERREEELAWRQADRDLREPGFTYQVGLQPTGRAAHA